MVMVDMALGRLGSGTDQNWTYEVIADLFDNNRPGTRKQNTSRETNFYQHAYSWKSSNNTICRIAFGGRITTLTPPPPSADVLAGCP